jgi:hypothetical protein
MILYILLGFFLLLAIILLFIRIKNPFWSIQPVFHYYDFLYWFYNKGIIRAELPDKNRYTNFKNIETVNFSKLTNTQINEATKLIQYNYLKNKENNYFPKKENILPYFEGNSYNSFWTFYWQPNILVDNKTGLTIDDKRLIGFISGRPLQVEINTTNMLSKKLNVYYVDYLCVDKMSRKKGIAPQLIQTHEYNQSHYNKNICVSLFKREDQLTGIIPLTVYNSYCFNMINWKQVPILENKYKMLTADNQNIFYLYNFINETHSQWDIIIWPEISNIASLVNTNNLIIKMILLDKEIIAVYIFKKTCTTIEEHKEILDCIASIKGPNIENIDFINGFKLSLHSIREKYSSYNYLTIEETSHNNIIINNLFNKNSPFITSPTAYFFYNFAYSTFNSNKCLIIC